MESLIVNDLVKKFAEAREYLARTLHAKGIRRLNLWGASATAEVLWLLLKAEGFELANVYDNHLSGEFHGLPIQDPRQGFEALPTLIASGQEPERLAEVAAFLSERGAAVFYATDLAPDTPSVHNFCNRHRGETGVVMGNGPSLNRIDLTRIRDLCVIGSNRVYLGFEQWGWSCPYWAIEDQLVAADIAPEWNQFKGSWKFVPRDLRAHVTNFENLSLIPFKRRWFGEEGPRFSADDEPFYWGGTVSYLLLQLAAFMGLSRIVLIGIDFSYARPDHVVSLEQEDHWLSQGDDPNHFRPDYFGAGRKWHDPNLERMYLGFSAAARALAARGVEVVNATPGTKLDVFPKVDYDSVFPKKSR